ncbi:MAG: glycerate kinase, partial [bacterium]|nr:glycerate kinase [bacterium]
RHRVPVVILTGSMNSKNDLFNMPSTVVISLAPGPITLDDSIKYASKLLEKAAEKAMKLISIGMKQQQ